MVARLFLALLLALGAVPAAAMPTTCHLCPAAGGMTMAAVDPTPDHRPHPDPVPADHGCLGCAALGAVDGTVVAAPTWLPPLLPVAILVQLIRGAAPPPSLRPPRMG